MRSFKNIFVSTFAAFLFAAGFSVTAYASDSAASGDTVGEVTDAAAEGSTDATDRGGIEATDRGGLLSELIDSMIGE